MRTEGRADECERTKVNKEQALDIVYTCVAGSKVSQDEFDQEQAGKLARTIETVEGLAERITAMQDNGNRELKERIEKVSADMSTRIIKSSSTEAASRAHAVGKIGESVTVVASRVDGLQDSVVRCRSECARLSTIFSDIHRNMGENARGLQSRDGAC